MGIGEQITFEERLRRKFAIIVEAEKHGSAVVRASEPDAPGVSAAPIFQFVNDGARHLYGEVHAQGPVLEGLLVEPGEHHALLHCGVPAAAAFLPDRGWCSPSQELAQRLQATEAAVGLGKRDWKWYQRRGGRAFYRAEWCAQVRPLARGTHLVMRGVQAHPFEEADLVGIGLFLRLARVLHEMLASASGSPAAPEPFPTGFGDAAVQLLGDVEAWRPTEHSVDLGAGLHQMLASMAGEEVTVGRLPPKRLELAQRALPEAAKDFPVVGVLGSAGFLRGTEVLTVTPTHAFVVWKGIRTALPWSDVVDAQPIGEDNGACLLRSRRVGWVPIPGCGRARALADGFRAIAAANA